MKILFVFAHPDDESFFAGGTIAKLTQQGKIVTLITATKGEAGVTGGLCTQEALGRVREQELRDAAEVLGISEIFFLGFTDGTLHALKKKQLEEKILLLLQKEEPDIIVSFDKHGVSNHPDHKAVSLAATVASKIYIKSAKKHVRLYHTAVPQSFIVKYKNTKYNYNAFGEMIGTPDEEITTIMDIKDVKQKKIKAFKCHKTQKYDMNNVTRNPLFGSEHEYFKLITENAI